MSTAKEIYGLYPRHLAPKEAIRAIEKALKRLPGELEGKIANETEWLKERVAMFAESDAGRADGLFPGYKPPYPATWFNKTRYLDDATEWFTDGKHQRDIKHTAQQKRELYSQADPECRECYGGGRVQENGKYSDCVCVGRTMAKGTDRRPRGGSAVGSSGTAQARFEEFEEIPARAMGDAANGAGKGAV